MIIMIIIIIIIIILNNNNNIMSSYKNKLWAFDWHIYIRPWPIIKVKVKVMYIMVTNIS